MAIEIADLESDWVFADTSRVAKINSISLQIEERAESGLAVGISIGYLSMRVGGDSTAPATKFEAQNLQVYLRPEFPLGESMSLETLLSYGYYTGDENVASDSDRADIEWSQVRAEIGVSFRFKNLRVTPFTSYSRIDGDISGLNASAGFELEDPFNQGVRFDIFVERTAFIGIRLQTGSQPGGYLSFVRRY
ncbi:MAG TPA: hypothetical protein VMZ32_08495 [Gammaproteobacteria bacterium]|nr:hypothetical protein [Gammaproteobacteria bacterium]